MPDTMQCFLGEECTAGLCQAPYGIPSVGQERDGSELPVPTSPKFHSTYSAIAVSPSTGKGSVSFCQVSAKRAQREAVQGCSETGAKDCALITMVENGFVAIAAYQDPESGKPRYAGGAAKSKGLALKTALEKCGDARCQIREVSDSCALKAKPLPMEDAGSGSQTLPGKPYLDRSGFEGNRF